MHTKQEYLETVIPYRMKAISIFHVALKYVSHFDSPKRLEIYLDGKLSIEGLSTAWTNPAIESGIMHCRAMLEFLGLNVDPKNPEKLVQRSGRRPTDLCLESYGLDPISISDALNCYDGPVLDAEKALASVIYRANKGVAHATLNSIVSEDEHRLFEIAARGVPTLVINSLYLPLKLEVPDYQVPSRRRENA